MFEFFIEIIYQWSKFIYVDIYINLYISLTVFLSGIDKLSLIRRLAKIGKNVSPVILMVTKFTKLSISLDQKSRIWQTVVTKKKL